MSGGSRAKIGFRAGLSVLLSALPVAAWAQFARPEPGLPPTAEPPVPPIAPTAPALHERDIAGPLQRGQTVFERPRPEYDPIGVRLGSFFFYPRAELEEVYNDNIFATRHGTDDFLTVVSPSAALLSNWGTHALNFRVGASVGTFARHTTENFGEYYIAGSGRYDIDRFLSAYGDVKFAHLHEDREDPTAPGGTRNPIEFDSYTATAGIVQKHLRIGYDLFLQYQRFDYENAQLNTGVIIGQQIRNDNVFTPTLRLSYEIVPNYEAFVRASGVIVAYDNSSAGGVFPTRDSSGYRIDAGARIDLTGVTYGEIYAGYLSQSYNNNRFGTIEGADAGARLVWNPDTLTSVIFGGDRQVVDANTFAAFTPAGGGGLSAGYLRSSVSALLEHELLRNVLVNASVIYENDDYQGINRTDDRIDLTAGVRYLLNHNLYLGAAYTYTDRDSTGTDAFGQFSRNLFMIRLTGQM